MRFLKLTIAYDGTRYVGWQVQKNGLAVQQVLETAWTSLTGETLRITASGRTDSGVHALAQVCSLSTNSSLSADRLILGLNAHMPADVRVLEVESAPVNFHSIRDATQKTYRYQLQTGRVQDPFQRAWRWFIPQRLNVPAMRDAASSLVGKHDFSSFEATGASRENSIRTVTNFHIRSYQPGPFPYIDIEISADGFLYNMVRNIVGTLIVVGRGKEEPDWIRSVVEARHRQAAAETAPPHGLFLVRVEYEGIQFSSA